MNKWNRLEIDQRIADARQDGEQKAADNTAIAKAYLDSLRCILANSLKEDLHIEWESLIDRNQFTEFEFRDPPAPPQFPPIPPLPGIPETSDTDNPYFKRWKAHCDAVLANHDQLLIPLRVQHAQKLREWDDEKTVAYSKYMEEKQLFEKARHKRNEGVARFKNAYEAGDPAVIAEYISDVLARDTQTYPDGVNLIFNVGYKKEDKIAIVDVLLPVQSSITRVRGYRYARSKNTMRIKHLKQEEHDKLYDEIVYQIVLRTTWDIYNAVRAPHVKKTLVNGMIRVLDEATGHYKGRCIISLRTERENITKLDLAHVVPSKCVRFLQAEMLGAPHTCIPITTTITASGSKTEDDSHTQQKRDSSLKNTIDTITWDEFEVLVGKLFERLFKGAKVEVTQRTRDHGVDAYVYDPDPLKGGKYIVQVKKYTNPVPASEVRALYGTMVSEGAVRGFLVTTSRFGPESKIYARENRIHLIDRKELLKLLGEHEMLTEEEIY